jgi:DNA-binding NtrC family response regulator
MAAPDVREMDFAIPRLLGESAAMRRVREALICLSSADLPVLLRGESGTGKTLAASVLAELSGCSHELSILDCTANAPSAATIAMLERRLSQECRPRRALLIEELGDAPLYLQDIVVRHFRAVAGLRSPWLLIGTTGRDLENLAHTGRLRRELVELFATRSVWLPPLRMRPADVGMLAKHFTETRAVARRRQVALSNDALQLFRAHRWPGNAAQLASVVEKAIERCDGPLITAAQIERALGAESRRSYQPETPVS